MIGVSEIENRTVLEDLVNAEPIRDRGLKFVHHDSPDARGVDVGLLYNPKLLRLLKVENYRETIHELPNFTHTDQLGTSSTRSSSTRTSSTANAA